MLSLRSVLFLTGTVLILALAPPTRAEEAASGEELGEVHAETFLHPNALSVFLGATSGKEGTDATVGLEYLRHLSGLVGIAVTGERVLGDGHTRAWVFALTTEYVIRHEWILGFGPGLELRDEEEGTEREVFARFSVKREFAFADDRYAVAPTVALDAFPREVKWVWGVILGVGF